MKTINTRDIPGETWASPKGNFASVDLNISVMLGRVPDSTDAAKRHPFDVEICRIPAGKRPCPYHSHSMQWEFYHVLSGAGSVRDKEGRTPIKAGDAFIFGPGEPHEITSGTSEDLVLYVVADNPIGESCHYPDSNKWQVQSPVRKLIRSDPVDYFDGEE